MPDDEWLVLHTVRVKGLAPAPAVAEATGLAPDAVATAAAALVEAGLVVERTGRLAGWSLTPDGRARHAELIGASVGDASAVVTRGYEEFLALNGSMLQLCTDWQLRDGAVNDHTDAAYDQSVVDRLGPIDDAVQPVVTTVADAVARFAGYGPRLAAARRKVEAGDGDWLTKPMIDSYHTVWFELHEDLLVTLGIERASETVTT
jgi:hypothetical protein